MGPGELGGAANVRRAGIPRGEGTGRCAALFTTERVNEGKKGRSRAAMRIDMVKAV